MRVSKVALLAATVLTASVFAQPQLDEFRFSGDMSINPGFDISNSFSWHDGNKVGERRSSAFNMQYGWNVNMGLDFNDYFSMDFRLSNPSGHALDQLNFTNGSVQGVWAVPQLPNAYFTWRTGGLFSLKGGLLRVDGNTVLDLVAGAEASRAELVSAMSEPRLPNFGALGLWTHYSSWDATYNASQAGLQFCFDITDGVGINLTTALVKPSNYVWNQPHPHNEFRFILNADLELSHMLTLSPTIATRSFWRAYNETNDQGETTPKTPILFSYGVDAGVELNDMVNLNAGIALGNVRLDQDNSAFGFLFKVAPEITFGINEVFANYSLGILSVTEEVENDDNGKFTGVFNDLHLGWHFRMNENIAFGPAASMAFSSFSVDGDATNGLNNLRFGLEFRAGF